MASQYTHEPTFFGWWENLGRIIAALSGFYIFFWVTRATYRIFFHPLSRYPGSPLAAASKPWYEWYWNFHQKGELLFEIERQHERLGPAIRIAPNELHINDPEVFQDMTKVGSKFTKDPAFYNFITFPGTSIGETDSGRHRIRRLVLTPAFSPARVLQEIAPMVKEKVDLLLQRFEEFADQGKPVNIFNSTKAFTMDVISKIVLGRELDCIRDPQFRNQFIEYLHSTFDMGWTATAFPNLTAFSLSLPEWLSQSLFPIPLLEFRKKCIHLIENYLRDRNVPVVGDIGQEQDTRKEDFNKSVVIDTLVDPSSARDHTILDAGQVADEVIMLLSAGNDTTSDAMIVGIYQIVKNNRIYEALNAELNSAFPKLEHDITYNNSCKLPYLTAVIKEVLRYSSPLPGRAPRVVPPEGYLLYGHPLPSGTVINTSSYLLNRHRDTWSRPNEFIPERWQEPDSARLEKYMASFYRGTRQCLGKDLALCELYVLLANLFRRFELEIHETTDEDMKWIDLLLIYFTGRHFHAKLKRRRD